MILTLAVRNLLHDRMRLLVTLVGIVFSVVLVAVQLGLYLGAERMIASILDRSPAELWVMNKGTRSVVDASVMSGRERHALLGTPGVASASALIVSFSEWRKPSGGTASIVLIGADPGEGALEPWSLVDGEPRDLFAPDGVAVDRTYFEDLGLTDGIGEAGSIEGLKARVVAITSGIRSFTTAPYVFTSLARARNYLDVGGDVASFMLVRLADGTDLQVVRRNIAAGLPNAEVLTTREFRDRTLDNWLFATGAGGALIIGAILGLLVGTVIVAQTLYASTKDHLPEFATLRALGSTTGYIHRVILSQAWLAGIIGFVLAFAISLVVVRLSRDTAMPIVMTPLLGLALFGLTLAMCAVSAVAAIQKVTRIDPATVFGR